MIKKLRRVTILCFAYMIYSIYYWVNIEHNSFYEIMNKLMYGLIALTLIELLKLFSKERS